MARKWILAAAVGLILVVIVGAGRMVVVHGTGLPSNIYLPIVFNSPPRLTAPPSTNACAVKSIQKLGLGKSVNWSATTGLVALASNTDIGSNGSWQIYTQPVQGGSPTCLTCVQETGGPLPQNFKTSPYWSPNGQWIVMQAEMNTHYGYPQNQSQDSGAFILNGWYNDLFVMNPATNAWYQLTHYDGSGLASRTKPAGALIPTFSFDGTKLLWSAIVGLPDSSHPFGYWELQRADFVLNSGVPSLQNVTDPVPSSLGGTWFESGGFSPDGQTMLFISDIGLSSQYGMDLWSYSSVTGKFTNLTNSPNTWDEHAGFSPHGTKIAWMSSLPYPGINLSTDLKTEIMLMNPDGSDVEQVTHFNTPGYPEYSPSRSVAAGSSWSPDGTQLLVEQLLSVTDYPQDQDWLVTFNGQCG